MAFTLQVINLKFAQIVACYKVYRTTCKIFSLLALKLRPSRSKMRKHNKFMSIRGAVANFNIAQPTFTSAFNIVWTKPYHSTKMRLPAFC